MATQTTKVDNTAEKTSVQTTITREERTNFDKRAEALGFGSGAEYLRSLIEADAKGIDHDSFVIENRERRITELENWLADANDNINKLKADKESLNEVNKKLELEFSNLNNEFDDYKLTNSSIIDDINKIENLQSEVSRLKSESFNYKQQAENERSKHKDTEVHYRGKVDQLNSEISDIKNELDTSQKDAASLKQNVQEWIDKSTEQENEVQDLRSNIITLESDLSSANVSCERKDKIIQDTKNALTRADGYIRKAHSILGHPSFRQVFNILMNWISPETIRKNYDVKDVNLSQKTKPKK